MNPFCFQRRARGVAALVAAWVILIPSALTTLADYDLTWFTVGAAGQSTGGGFALDGSFGQPDAGVVMTGGGFTLTGGFWAVVVSSPQFPQGDLNCDGLVNNQDIDGFILALFNPAGYAAQYPNCNILNGDFTGDGLVNNQDIDGFVTALFGGPP